MNKKNQSGHRKWAAGAALVVLAVLATKTTAAKSLSADDLFDEAVHALYWEDQKVDKVYPLFEAAAQRGHVLAPAELALLNLRRHQQSDSKDAGKLARDQARGALPDLRSSAENGSAHAQFLMSWYHSKTDFLAGFGRSLEAATQWARRSADQGYPLGQEALGAIYLNGQGVAKDGAKAAELFQQAAKQGFPAAQAWLGFMYISGKGVPADQNKGLAWFRKAAKQGDLSAQAWLALIYTRDDLQDFKEAAKWARIAAKRGSVSAQGKLGDLYLLGLGVPKDRNEAINWYRKAARQGHSDSKERLIRLGTTWE